MNPFLHSDPLPWLIDPDYPAIRFRVLRDVISGATPEDYSLIQKDRLLRSIPDPEKTDKLPGDLDHYDFVRRGTMWFFCLAAECGLDRRTPLMEKTAAFLLGKTRTSEGGFPLSSDPPLPLSCRTGDMIHALIQAGFTDNSVSTGISWILTHQRHDGGWLHCPEETFTDSMKLILFNRSGGGLRRENRAEVESCIHATGSCLRALLDWPYPDETIRKAIDRAVNFFLERNLFINRRKCPRLTYSAFFRYDILQGLLLIARAGRITDVRTGPAFNLLMKKQNPDGTWNMESSGHAMGSGPDWTNGKPSRWVTMQCLLLLKMMQDQEGGGDQL